MFRKGTRLFSASTILLIVVAAMHTGGVFSTPTDQDGIALVQSMRDYTFDVGMNMRPSVYDIHMSLGLTMTAFLLFLAVINFVIVRSSAGGQVLRTIALVNAACMWSLAILYWVYQVFPPFISFVALGVLFTGAYVTSDTKSTDRRSHVEH